MGATIPFSSGCTIRRACALGPSWTSLPTDKKNAILVTFDKFMVTTYAARFKAFSGQKFEVGASKPVAGDRTLVGVALLEGETRVGELARMLGGSEATAVQHARELLAGAGQASGAR